MSITKTKGFTLIELIVVIVIAGILATIALKHLAPVTDRIRIEETMREMDMLAAAIAGNPDRHTNGTRSDYGYIGDVGALPPDLDALVTNPGYTTWNGPYMSNRWRQTPEDFKRDAWQAAYAYSGGVSITSVGSGNSIVRNLATSIDPLLYNSVSGSIIDLAAVPPGEVMHDSIRVILTVPDGAGGITDRTITPDPGGAFAFDSIPIGNHDLTIIYLPASDTLRRFVSVSPGSDVYGEYRLPTSILAGP